MSEAETTLKQKAAELETAVDETRRELSRVDEGQRTDVHRELVRTCKEATEWLEECMKSPPGSTDQTASLTQKAEAFLRDLRLRRGKI
jgi:hypothetical protein